MQNIIFVSHEVLILNVKLNSTTKCSNVYYQYLLFKEN